MADTTVSELAKIIKIEDKKLIEILGESGIKVKSGADIISDDEKNTLLAYIRGNNKETVTVKRKSMQKIKVDGSRKVNVEVRKKKKINIPSQVSSEAHDLNKSTAKTDLIETKEANTSHESAGVAPLVSKDILDDTSKHDKTESSVESKDKNSTPADASPAISKEPISKGGGLKFVDPADVKYKKPAASSFNITHIPEKTAEKKPVEKKEPIKRVYSSPVKTKKPQESESDRARAKNSRKDKDSKKGNSNLLHQINNDFEGFGSRKGGRRLNSKKIKTQQFTKPLDPVTKQVIIYDGITVNELSQKMAIKAAEVIKALFKMGVMATINQPLDQDTAILIVEEHGHSFTLHKEEVIEKMIAVDHGDTVQIDRAPVVTIMGHVDHGKTSLLDYIRKTRIASGEAGGITQHIGAYSVATDKGLITFLDTPGHEAFTAMRSRGAGTTDIVILVVAADDGVMPQTIEAIQHAKAANVPIIVAVNKIDKPEADPDRVKNELGQHNVIPEDWGGDVIFTHVSAKTGEGIPSLLDAVLLQSEVLELKAVKDGYAEGTVIESRLEKGRGAVATILIRKGTLNQGDVVLCGTEFGRVRAMTNDIGQKIKSAGPSVPVEILGLSGVPNAGDGMISVKDEKKAKEVAEHRLQKRKESKLKQQQAAKLSSLFDRIGEEEQEILKVIVKADVQGSVEAIRESLLKLSTDAVKVEIIISTIGGINSSDVNLAVASGAVIFGFNVRADAASRKQAEAEGTEIRYYNIIYDLIDDIKQAMSGLLSPEMREKLVGIANVRDVFRSSKYGSIAGCMVIEGTIKRNNPIRVLRDNIVIYEGSLESLKRFKDDASEVKKGLECGIGVKNYNDIKENDQIEVFEMIEVERKI